MLTSEAVKIWNYERLLSELPSESRYEIRNAHLIDMPSPSEKHQELVFKLTLLFGNYIIQNKLGKFYQAPFDVILDNTNVVQPDLLLVLNENKEIIKERGVFGSPDLVVEIVSKGSVIRDYVEKKEDYERFGVKEYWLIDPQNELIQVFALQNTKYVSFSYADEDGTVKSKILDGFEMNWNDIFKQ